MEFFGIEISLWMLIALMVAAFVAGFIDSVAGGGGVILIPSFILAGLPPHMALGQEKIVSTLGTIAAIRNFVKNKKVIWRAVAVGMPAGLLGAYLGAKVILYFDADTVGKIIIALLPFGILLSLFPKGGQVKTDAIKGDWLLYVGIPATVFFIGFYDGFFGPGTGSFLILALHYILKFDLVSASANSKMFNLSSNVGALIAFIISGNVLYMLALPLVVMNLLGNHVGSGSAIRYGPKMVRMTLTCSMLLLMGSLSYKYILA